MDAVVGDPDYRWIRHPNYVAVFVELLALPLVHTAWITAALGAVAHLFVLRARIRIEDRVLTIRTGVGTRLNALDTSEEVRANDKLEVQTIVSGLEDLDYTEAITRLNQQLTGLQAAQQSYAKLSQLSLFDYLR